MSDLFYDFDERITLDRVVCPPNKMKTVIQVWREGASGLGHLIRQGLEVSIQDQTGKGLTQSDLLIVRQMCMQHAGVQDAKRAGGECFEVDESNPALYVSAVRRDVTSMNGVMGFLLFVSYLQLVSDIVTIPVSWRMSGSKGESGRSAYRVVRADKALTMLWSPKGDGVFEKWTAD